MTGSAAIARPLRRDALANRERIVAAARDAFSEHGVDASVEEIARRAGVGMGTLYRRFPTKEDLVDAVFEDTLAEFERLAREALVAEDAWLGFRTFLEQTFALHAENRGLKDILMRSPGRANADAMRARMRPLIRGVVERAQADGTLRTDFEPEDVPVLFWSVARVIEATASVAPDFWRRPLALALDGLRAEAATPLPHGALTRAQLDAASPRRRA